MLRVHTLNKVEDYPWDREEGAESRMPQFLLRPSDNTEVYPWDAEAGEEPALVIEAAQDALWTTFEAGRTPHLADVAGEDYPWDRAFEAEQAGALLIENDGDTTNS